MEFGSACGSLVRERVDPPYFAFESKRVGYVSGNSGFSGLARGSRAWLGSLAVLLLLGLPLGASATPTYYSVNGGSVQLTVIVGGNVIGQTTSPGLTGSFALDHVAKTLNDIDLSLLPNISLDLTSPYGGYDEITIESAALTADPGFVPLGTTILNPASYIAAAGPLTVNGFWSAIDSSGVLPNAPSTAIAYAVNAVNAVVNISPLITMTGVALTSLNGLAFGELEDLTVLATISVTSALTVVPEPGTALLTGFGLVLMVAFAPARPQSRDRSPL